MQDTMDALLRIMSKAKEYAEDLNEKDTADDRQTNVEEAIKELESLIAQQIKEAYKAGYISKGIEDLT